MTQEPDADPARHPLRAWISRRRTINTAYRAAVLVVGVVVTLAGVAMLVLPGPGWAALILGLVILATEFAWAERLLDPVRRGARWAADRALDPKVRRRNQALLVIALAVVGGLAAGYVIRYGWSLEPLPFVG